MNPVSSGWKLGGAVALATLVIVAVSISGPFSSQFSDNGIDVRNTACEELASARLAVATELGERKAAAQESLDADMDAASNNYWERHQGLQSEYRACISRALTADPCKEPSDRITSLYHEIMADFDAGKGFNEAKFNEREQAKKEYNECVEKTHKPEFYKDQEAKCEADFTAAQATNLTTRQGEEAAAKTKYDAAVLQAEAAHNEKQAILNAIEKKCTEPGKTSTVLIGALTSEGSGAAVSPNSASCTGLFGGNDPAIQRQIALLESQLQKAKAAEKTEGIDGTSHIQSALDRLRQELKETPRSCKIDADCGSVEPVCCSGTEVGRAICSAGVCSAEKTTCVSPEICAGKPAQCVAPYTGAQQQDGIYITRTIPEVGACSQNLQVLDLKQATPDSTRYSLGGNIPSWLHIDKPSGSLPGAMNVTYSCDTVQGFGPGTYTANGAITVYNAANELINTIPFNVSITVTPSAEEMIEVILYNSKYLPVSQLIIEDEVGCGADHWHAAQGVVIATDGTPVSDPGPQCGYGKVKDLPVKKIPAPTPKVSVPGMRGEVRGLEGLKGW